MKLGYFPSQVTLVLVSGGGSALLPVPLEGLTLDEKSELVRKLHAAGAPIQDVNAVRTFLSKVFSRSSKVFFWIFLDFLLVSEITYVKTYLRIKF